MFSLFKPAAHIERLPAEQSDQQYKQLRWRIFLGIFVGYAGYYLVRKNFSLAMPFLIEEHGVTNEQLAIALSAVSILLLNAILFAYSPDISANYY